MISEDIIEGIIEQFRNTVIPIGVDSDGEFNETPDFNPIYARCIDLAEQIKTHSRGLHFPARLFDKKIPNESDEMRDYREHSYRPYTKSVWKRGVVNYDRTFNKQNFSITEWGNNSGVYSDDTAQDYFMMEYPKSDNIVEYYAQMVKNIKLEDPNGVDALFIDNALELEDTELVEPYGKMFECSQRLFYTEDYEVLLSHERSDVSYGNSKEKPIGFILYVYDDTNIYVLTQTGKFIDYKFEWEVYYEHDLGYVPVKVLGGVPEIEGDYIVYHSHAEDAIYSLDDIAIDKSTLQASKISHAYLEKWEALEDCPDPNCVNGYTFDDNGKHECGVCEGTGKFNRDALKRYIVSVREGNDSNVPIPPAGYIDKDPEILEFLNDQILFAEQASFAYMGIDVSNTKADGQSDTAMGKMIDREALFSALMQFSDEVFDLMAFEIKFCGEVRYKDFQEPEIRKPINFALRGENDLTEEYGNAKDKGLPDEYNSKLYKQLIKLRFSSDKQVKRVDEIAQYVDSLYLKTREEINVMFATNQIPLWKSILHYSFDTYLVRKVDEDEDYLDNSNEDIKKDLEKEAQQEAVDLKTGTTEEILGEEGVTDAEAEAKAKLKGTVGGVQGIIQINQAVARKEMTESSAEVLLQEIYGFSAEIAGALIEAPTGEVEEIAKKVLPNTEEIISDATT